MTHKRRGKRHGKKRSGTNERKAIVNQIKRCVRQMRGTANRERKVEIKKRADGLWWHMQRLAKKSGGGIPHITGYQPPSH